jgi:hypothetical protein
VISQPPKKTGDSWETGFSNGYHWLSEPGRQWTVPVGGGFAKMFHIAGQHIQLAIDSYYKFVS